jgi:hypothetical protein
MNTFYPASGNELEWKDAQFRLEAYLRALHLTDSAQTDQILQTALQQAAIKHAQNPAESPTVLALNEARDLLECWFEKIVPSAERSFVTGLVSWHAIGGFERWPAGFMAEPVPRDLQRAFVTCGVRAAPDLRVSRMVPQPFDHVLTDLNLPTALGQLTKDLSPSLVARAIGFVLSAFTVLWGNRMR